MPGRGEEVAGHFGLASGLNCADIFRKSENSIIFVR